MHDLNILKTEMGFLIMSALAVNDIIGWVVFTIVLSLFREAGPDVLFLVRAVVFTSGFAAFALWTGPRISTWIVSAMHRSKMPEPASSLTFTCLLGLLFGSITQLIGIHALFGFFIAGVMVGEAKPVSEESRNIISQVVYSVFVPVFFAGIGLKIDFIESFDLPLALFISLIGIAGRFFGAWVGVTLTGSFRNDRRAIAVAHTPGGVMEIVVALLALSSGLITNEVFVGIVFAALLSSTVMGPWLTHAIRRQPPIIRHYVSPATVIPGSIELSRDAQIEQLCRRVAARTDTAPDHLLALVLGREREYSTALENGIAIPHARLDEITQPTIAYARSYLGIDWNSPDGKPAHHIFLLAMPRKMESEQVQILAAIARMMFAPANREFLESAPDAEAIAEGINRRLASALREQR
jgi:Kef-type K+ transport system membrane component KefB